MQQEVDSKIAPTDCLFCGTLIPPERRGHGSPPKTCSERCRRARASEREKQRYAAVKGTEDWKKTRAMYMRKLRRKLDADPEFRRIFLAHSAARNEDWRRRLRQCDADRHEAMKAEKRAERAAWRERMVKNPAAWEAHKAAARAWYRGLTADERERIFYAPRRNKDGSKAR